MCKPLHYGEISFFLPLGCDINKTLEAAAKVLVQLCIFAVVYKKYIFELYLYHTL